MSLSRRLPFVCSSLSMLVFLNSVFKAPAIEDGRYQLIGRIKLAGGQEFSQRALPVVMLDGTKIPFTAHTRADMSGVFRFKGLRADLFTIIVYMPRLGECRQTAEVSKSLADSGKRVFVDVPFQPGLASKAKRTVTSTQLSIPEKALAEYDTGNKKLGRHEPERAMEHFKKAVAIAPQFAEAWNALGTLAYKSNQFPLAESYFREAQKHDPDHYPSLVNLGGALLSQGKIQDSLALNRAAVQTMPDDALAHAQLGLNYYFLENYAEAETYLKQATILDPGHFSYPQLPLAEIYMRRQDFTSAMRQLEQVIALHPDAKQAPAVREQILALRAHR